jgi:hypothetical protein
MAEVSVGGVRVILRNGMVCPMNAERSVNWNMNESAGSAKHLMLHKRESAVMAEPGRRT